MVFGKLRSRNVDKEIKDIINNVASSMRTARFIFLLIFVGGFCIFVLTPYIVGQVYIIMAYFVRKRFNKRWRDKAIRIG